MRVSPLVVLLWLWLIGPVLAQTPTPIPTATPQPSGTPQATPTPSTTPPQKLEEPTKKVQLPKALAQIPGATLLIPSSSDSYVNLRGPFSGRILFQVRAGASQSAKERAARIFERLQATSVLHQSGSLEVEAKVYSDIVVLSVNDTVLATVLPEDLHLADSRALPQEHYQATQREIGLQWRRALQLEVEFSSWIYTANYFKLMIGGIFFLLIAAWTAGKIYDKIRERYRAFPAWSLRFLTWIVAGVVILWLVPWTKSLAWFILATILQPFLEIWIIAVIVFILCRLAEGVLKAYINGLVAEPGVRIRRVQRLKTLENAGIKTFRVIAFLLVVALSLVVLPFNFLPLVTSAGVVGVAIGLAAQDLLKDIFAGISILLEDRFGVGDWIECAGQSGEVESVDLRITRLRDTKGTLIIIPNSELRVIKNLSNEWSQVDYMVGVSYQTDVEKALEILEDVAHKLFQEWPDKILAVPELKGVQSLGPDSVILRIFLKTKPSLQWEVEREFNKRIKLRFDAESIEIPFPQRSVWVRSLPEK